MGLKTEAPIWMSFHEVDGEPQTLGTIPVRGKHLALPAVEEHGALERV